MAVQSKRLTRSQSQKMIAGVCGGIAEYLNADPTVVRIAWIVLSLFPLIPGILLYIIAWMVIPKEQAPTGSTGGTPPRHMGAALFGFFFIALGSVILLSNLHILELRHWWRLSWDFVIPLLLIATGLFVVLRPGRIPGITASTQEEAKGSVGNRKTLFRSLQNRKLFGVCGGLAEYFEIDPSIVRVAFIFFSLWPFGLGLVAYLVLLFVLPEHSQNPQPQT